jgi:hypothetical protein
MNYNDLNKTQKRLVDAFISLRPELATSGAISRSEVEELFQQLYEKRDAGGQKIGYPMWLVKGPKVSRGVYVFPAPNVTHSNVINTVAKRTTALSKEDEEFLAELREAGIDA